MMPKTKAARMFVAKGFLCVARQQAGIFDTLRHKKDITESASSPLGGKYLVFVSSRSVKLTELSFAQFVYFWRKVCCFFLIFE